ncbi:MAG: adenylate/guanylate cyclase domain-containing protein [Spirochaetes bacterium]|nr:MAG: adenylate/guanylate cyclase domain-containing protein [Spirochaetota bacterium]
MEGFAMKENKSRGVYDTSIGGTRITSVVTKIIIIFTVFILISNLTSNYINLTFNRAKMISLMQQMLGKDLKDIYQFCNNQYEIYHYNEDLKGSIEAIENKGLHEFKNEKSVLLGVKPDGNFLFQAAKSEKAPKFADVETMTLLEKNRVANVSEGLVNFRYHDEDYFGIYKFNAKWNAYIVRGEELGEFYSESRIIFRNISLIIILITAASAIAGIYVLRYMLRFIRIITTEIMQMVSTQKLRIVDLKGAPNDDITFLGVAFNSLASTINNLLSIFSRFANKDVVIKAYEEREVRLEGTQKELTIMFTDIKSFTFITETLGADIIKLLNLHYDKAIRDIHSHDGLVGSIIGDALLAVFGALDEYEGEAKNKSLQAIQSAYKLQEIAQILRDDMGKKRKNLERTKGGVTSDEERVYQAVLLEIGVGIDGGNVFYGNIGSYVRMTNTVIGDNVNAASRLEGLTRVYKVPVICSEFVKNDIETNVDKSGVRFVEIDTVQVKGKTKGTKIYWPVLQSELSRKAEQDVNTFNDGLASYYRGEWTAAARQFNKCSLTVAQVMYERVKDTKPPHNWNGVWEMKTK